MHMHMCSDMHWFRLKVIKTQSSQQAEAPNGLTYMCHVDACACEEEMHESELMLCL